MALRFTWLRGDFGLIPSSRLADETVFADTAWVDRPSQWTALHESGSLLASGHQALRAASEATQGGCGCLSCVLSEKYEQQALKAPADDAADGTGPSLAAAPTAPGGDGPQALGDDIGDNTSSTATISVGGSLSSVIDHGGDLDFIKVNLVAGQTYTFSLNGITMDDSYVELRNAGGTIVAQNDDGGIVRDSFLMYRATTSGEFWIVARGFDSSAFGQGTYELQVNTIPQGNTSPTTFSNNGLPYFSWDEAAIQINRSGAGWTEEFGTAPPTVITYAYRQSISVANMPEDTATFTQFNAAQITATEAMLAAWASVANIVFQRVNPTGYSNDATLLFGNYATGMEGAAAFAYTPINSDASIGGVEGDVWVNRSETYNNAPTRANEGYHVLLHEIGHALGLSHPGDYNASANENITYATHASYYNDSVMFTAMSYFGSTSTGGTLPLFSSLPQMHDIAAIQRIYGANTATRATDTTYGYNSNTGVVEYTLTTANQQAVFCIWDAGGIDTIDLSGYSTVNRLDLREEAFSRIGGFNNNVSIARGAVIENAIGGSGSDTITGNAVANNINGGGGIDTITGGLGNDTIQGGAGDDTINYAIGDGADTIDGGANTDTLAVSGTAGGDTLAVNWNGTALSIGGGTAVNVERIMTDLGDGPDTVVYSTSAALTVNLQTAIATGFFQLLGVENITGGSGNDTITGNGMENVLTGGEGNDTLNGGGDSDVLAGGLGDDTYIVDSDTLIENADEGTDTVQAANDFTLAANLENLNMTFGTFATGNAVNNVITANNAANTLSGLGGNDTLSGLDGADTLIGGLGADTLQGGAGNDTFTYSVGDGADTIEGGADTDTVNITGALGVDTLAVAYNGSALTGIGGGTLTQIEAVHANLGGGGDTLAYTTTSGIVVNLATSTASGFASIAGIANLSGGSGFDQLTGDNLANQLDGNDGNDTLVGNIGADIINGGAGADIINWLWGDGADTVDGGADGDTFNVFGNHLANTLQASFNGSVLTAVAGSTLTNVEAVHAEMGGGGDLLQYTATAAVTVNLAAGTATGFASIANIANVAGGSGHDNLTGNDAVNQLDGAGGNDTLNGGVGADALTGGLGNDTYVVDDAGDTTSENAAEGTDAVQASLDWTLASNVENLSLTSGTTGTGNAGNNTITGNGAANTLSGLDGNDTLNGDAGADTLVGGLGVDTINAGAGNDTINWLWGDGNGAIDGGADADTFNITGSAGSNILRVNFNGTALIAAAGNTLANVETVNAAMGGGGDLLEYVAASSAATVDLGTGAASGFATLSGIRDVTGGGGDDALTGDGVGNKLTGNDGADTLTGGAGNDELIGGNGADVFFGGLGSDNVDGDAGDDQFNWSWGDGNDTVDGGADFDTVTFTGSALSNLFKVGFDGTKLTGVQSNPLANIEAVHISAGGIGDWLMYKQAPGGVTVNLVTGIASGFASIAGINHLQGGTGDDSLTGDDSFNKIEGGDGNDTLVAGDGADQLKGGIGNDTLTGGLGLDTISGEDGDDAILWAWGDGPDTINGGIGTDSVTFTGNNVANLLKVSWNGTALTDVMSASLASIEAVHAIGGGGTDWIIYAGAGATANLTTNTASGFASIAGFTNLQGGAGNDSLTGDANANKIIGGDGADTLTGLGGTDTLTGGLGADTFVYAAGAGTDTIADFDADAAGGQDVLDITAFGITSGDFGARVSIVDVGNQTIVTIDGSVILTLQGVDGNGANLITADDFLLAP